ncbi:efflux RND transporter periplasmic adaptor subunit [Burkholderia cenocepacia]
MFQEKVKAIRKMLMGRGRSIAVVLATVLALLILLFLVAGRPAPVTVAIVKRGDMASEVEGTGTVTADVLANIAPQITGRVERVFVDEGDTVHAGQILAQLDGDERRHEAASAKAQLDSALTSARERHQEWQREKNLVDTGAVGREEAQQYQERDAVAQSNVTNAKAQLALAQYRQSLTAIRALSDGVVTQRWVVPGAAVVPGQTMFTVAGTRLVYVDAFTDQSVAGSLRPGQAAAILLRGYEHHPIQGTILRIRPRADAVTEETVAQVTFEWPASVPFQLGQWANVFVRAGMAKDALLVPKAALMSMGKTQVVWAVDAGNRVHPMLVQVTASSPRSPMVAVSGTLRAGDRVVMMPMGLHAGQKVRPTVAAPGQMAGAM